jgi:hypothetical protein
MSLPGDIQRYALIAVAAVVAAVGLFVVSGAVGGGSSSGGSDSAQQVLDRAFSSTQRPEGGRVRGTMTVGVSGAEAAAAGLSQPFKMTIDGVANPPRAGRPASFDMGVQVQGGGESHAMRVISTGRKGYVDVDGRAYELPSAQFRRFAPDQGGPGNAAALQSLGVDPGKWVSNVADAGTASVAGEQTRHVIADIDVPLMLADVMKVAERTGQAQQVPGEARDAIRDAVKSAKLEVFAAESDGTLRRVVATATFEAPGPAGKPVSGGVRFDLQVTKLDKPEKIVAPRNPVPFSRLDQGSLGFGRLGSLGGSSPAAAPKPSAASSPGRERGAEGAPQRSRQAANQAYVSCVQQAFDVPALMKCQDMLP